LGRAKDPKEYIKHGKDKAVVEIELHNDNGENFVVRREIRSDNSSEWQLNGTA